MASTGGNEPETNGHAAPRAPTATGPAVAAAGDGRPTDDRAARPAAPATASLPVPGAAAANIATPADAAKPAKPLGKALRGQTPRSCHGAWCPAADRRDPVEIIIESSVGRVQHLLPIRYGRMRTSPFAFYRGSAAIMAADLATTPSTGLVVQLCGDCHLLNFGVFATPERNMIFDVNDFDETLPGPWEWDVKRLAASFVIAGRHNGFRAGQSRAAVLSMTRSYREQMARFAAMTALDVWYERLNVQDWLDRFPGGTIREQAREQVRKASRGLAEHDLPNLIDAGGQVAAAARQSAVDLSSDARRVA